VSPLNKAGIMFRQSLVSGADYALLALSSSKRRLSATPNTLGPVNEYGEYRGRQHPGALLPSPGKKRGHLYRWIPKDSSKWTTIGINERSGINKTVYVGMAVCSHNNNIVSEVLFNWLDDTSQ